MVPVRGAVLVLLKTLKLMEPLAVDVITSHGALEVAVGVPVQSLQARLAGTEGASPLVDVPNADTLAENVWMTLSFASTTAPCARRYARTVSAFRRDAPVSALSP